MPYHEVFLGTRFDQLEPKTAALFIGFMKVAGAAFTSLGVGLGIITKGLITKGSIWGWRTILFMGIIFSVPLEIEVIKLGPQAPWWLIALLALMFAIALILSRPECKNNFD